MFVTAIIFISALAARDQSFEWLATSNLELTAIDSNRRFRGRHRLPNARDCPHEHQSATIRAQLGNDRTETRA
jgi:hypothetical protein